MPAAKGTILLTAGTGKTSQRMIPSLKRDGVPFLLTSRNPPTDSSGLPYVKFDMLDKSTWPNAFDTKGGEPKVSAIYLIAPEGTDDPVTPLNEFIQYAVEKEDVKRFVMMTGGSVTKGGFYVGQTWGFLDDLKNKTKNKGGVEYAFVKATWFMENFTEREHKKSIRTERRFYTGAGKGKVAFVAAGDIARVAYVLLTVERGSALLDSGMGGMGEEGYRALGPELLSHDEAAGVLSEGLGGKKVEHVSLSTEEIVKRYQENGGMPEQRAQLMGWLHKKTSEGEEEKVFGEGAVERVTGRKLMWLREWVEENRAAFD